MTRGGRRAWWRCAAAVLVSATLGAAGVPLLGAGQGAAAATAAPAVVVTVTAVSAPSITPGSTLVIRGAVRNPGSTPITGLRVELHLDWPRLDQAGVAAWGLRAPSERLGPLWTSQVVPGPVAAGASVPFTLTARADALALPAGADAFGPRGAALQVTGDPGSGGSRQLAVQRTFVVWDPRPGTASSRLAVLVPITGSAKDASADAGVAGPALRGAWAPGGRLARVLAATADPGISWAIDPALITAARTAPASGWLDALVSGSHGRSTYSLPWGDPDLAALAHADAVDLLGAAQDDALAVTRELFGTPLDVTLGWPADGLADAATIALLARNTGRTVVLSDATVTVPGAGQATARVELPRTRPDVTGLVADRNLSRAVAGMGGSGWALASQRVLAELAAAASGASLGASASAGSTAGSPVDPSGTGALFAAVPRGWDPQPGAMQAALGLLRAASWVRLERVADARTDRVAPPAKALKAYPDAAAAAELPADHVTAVVGGYDRLQRFAPALTRPQEIVPQQRRAALSLVGQDWRLPGTGAAARRTALTRARAPLLGAVQRLYDSVRVLSSEALLLGGSAPLSVTVTSTLNQPVNLVLTLHPPNGLLRVAAGHPVTLDAAAKGTSLASVRVEVVTGVFYGDVDVRATLSAPGATEPLTSQPAAIHVRIRRRWEDAGLIVSATLLAALLILGLVRGVRRGRKRLPPESTDDPDDVGRDPGWTPRGRRPDPTDPTDPTDPSRPSGPTDPSSPDGDSRDEAARPTEPILRTEPHWPPPGFPEVAWPPTPRTVLVPDDTGPIPVGAGSWFPAPATARASARNTAAVAWPDLIAPPLSATARVEGPARRQAPPRARRDLPEAAGVGAPPAGPSSGPPAGPALGSDGRASGGPDSAVLRSSALMSAGTLVSRVLGMVRVVVLSAAIGAKASGDAFNTANTIPNSLFILIGGGVLNAVLVPQIVRAARQPDGGQDYVDRLLTLAIAVLGGATVLLTTAAPLLVRAYARDWTDTQLWVGTVFAFWCLPQIFFYGLYTIYGQVLNARGSFGPYMWAPVVNNVVAIAGMGVYIAVAGRGERPIADWTDGELALLAGTTTLGVVAQALALLPVMRRSGYTWRPRWGWRGVGLRTAGTVAGWTFAGVAVSQLAFVLTSQVVNAAGRAAAATDRAGGRTVFDTAYLLFMLPHSLIAVSVVTTVFTRMSAAAGVGRLDAVREDLSYTLRTVGTATVLSTAAFLALGPDLTRGLFLGTPRSSTDAYAYVAGAMLLGLVPFSAQYLFQRVFYAFEDARTPFLITLVSTTVWTAGNLASRAFLAPEHVAIGVGVALSASSAVAAALTVIPLRRRLGSIDGARVLRTHVRLLVAAVVAGGLGVLVRGGVHAVFGDSRTASYLVLVVAGGTLVTAYLLLLRALRVTELDDLLRPLTARPRR